MHARRHQHQVIEHDPQRLRLVQRGCPVIGIGVARDSHTVADSSRLIGLLEDRLRKRQVAGGVEVDVVFGE